jgi:hypothetical protein
MVGSYAMSVAGQIVENVFGAAEGRQAIPSLWPNSQSKSLNSTDEASRRSEP